ncbi:hypothetical protein [Bacillus sp. Marseille-P3661]|nr:hypothetical protein [Bacillus sp. Marseille-P3661]
MEKIKKTTKKSTSSPTKKANVNEKYSGMSELWQELYLEMKKKLEKK